jgi:hypothetical protein
MTLPQDEAEYRSFMSEFEAGTLAKEQWHHPEHVAVAFWYLSRLEEELAIAEICRGIQNLNLNHGVMQTPTGGYHETWTIFFSKVLCRYMGNDLDRDLPLIQQMNCAIIYLSDFRDLTRQHYSRELITSWEARTSWREPDLKSL